MKKTTRHTGFSLIDLTIYGALLGILLVILSQFFITIISSQRTNTAQSALEQDATYILTRMTYDVRRANAITTPSYGATAGTLALTIAGQTYTYALSDGDMYLTVGASTEKLNSQDVYVSAFSVSGTGNSGVVAGAKDEVDITMTFAPRDATAGVNERTFSTHLMVR